MDNLSHKFVLVILLLLSFSSSAVTENKPQMVNAGGHKLNLLHIGNGTPTVVFDSGFSDTLEAWSKIQPEIAKSATTVSYDRAGLGGSDIGPNPRSAKQIATELKTVLNNIGVAPPYILVGWSGGGLFQTVFAATYPDDVAGLILVDPATAEHYDYMQKTQEWSNAFGVLDTLSPGYRGQIEALNISKVQVRESWPLPEIPVTLISAMKPLGGWPFSDMNDMKFWKSTHENLLKNSPNTVHIVAENSTHLMPIQEPSLVINVIRRHIESLGLTKQSR